MRIIYMGSPKFAVPALEAIHDAGHTIMAVFTPPDKPTGRGQKIEQSPVKLAARGLGLTIHQPEKLKGVEVAKNIESMNPDAIVVAAYSQILPVEILKIPKYGCINIHASLLPKYRGGAPIHWAIAEGERETGITIMRMEKGLDSGDIISMSVLPIGRNVTCGQLTEKLALLGAEMIVEVLYRFGTGEVSFTAQNHAEATYARNVRREDGKINWNCQRGCIHNIIRGLNPWPCAHTTLRGINLKIIESALSDIEDAGVIGTMQVRGKKVYVQCADGLLELITVQAPGKKPMSAIEFARGFRLEDSGLIILGENIKVEGITNAI